MSAPRDGFDRATFHLLLPRDLIAGPVGDERRVRPGKILVFDTGVPQLSRNDGSHTIRVALARDRLGRPIPDTRACHGAILSERAAETSLAAHAAGRAAQRFLSTSLRACRRSEWGFRLWRRRHRPPNAHGIRASRFDARPGSV